MIVEVRVIRDLLGHYERVLIESGGARLAVEQEGLKVGMELALLAEADEALKALVERGTEVI